MRFEKWQALGNDYLIVEATGVGPEQVRMLCDRHLGVGADGVLALAPADEPGYVARLRIYTPDGSEAELSGNGARQALGFGELLARDAEGMKARTRRYAKRQLTWMRKLPGVPAIDVTGRESQDVAAELHAAVRAREA